MATLLMAVSAYLISKAALVTGFAALAVAVTAVRTLAIGRALLRYSERYVTHVVTFRILTGLRGWFYSAVEALSPGRTHTYRSGDLLSRIAADIDTLDNFYVRVVVPPIAALLAVALACSILGAFDVRLGLVLLVFLVLAGVALPLLTHRLSRGPASALIDSRAELAAVLTDEIQGIADLTSFGRQQSFQANASALDASLANTQERLARIRGMRDALATLLAGLAGVVVLFVAIPLVTQGRLGGVFLALLPLAAIASFEAVQSLGTASERLAEGQAAGRRLFEIIDDPPLVSEPALPLSLPLDISIEFRHVCFRYGAGEKAVLQDLCFRITAGTHALLAGASGAGKTTVVNLLLRFWQPQAGQIFIGGHDTTCFRSDDVRSVMGVVPQHPYLFNGTVRDNLLLAKGDATDAEIIRACRLAEVDEFIGSLPHRLDTLVGENGLKLSGGERQRLAIARIFLKAAPIVVLDEPTANLDRATERRVLSALDAFLVGRTALIISHRPLSVGAIDCTIQL